MIFDLDLLHVYDYISREIEGQQSMLGSQFEMRSEGPPSSVKGSFLVILTVVVIPVIFNDSSTTHSSSSTAGQHQAVFFSTVDSGLGHRSELIMLAY